MLARDITKKVKNYHLRKRKNENTIPCNRGVESDGHIHYYCGLCGVLTDSLPEFHINPPQRICVDCHDLARLNVI